MALPAAGRSWKLLRFAVREAAYAIPSAVSYIEDLLDNNEAVDGITWMRWIVEWTRLTPGGTSEDKAQFKWDLLNITGGTVDSTWTAGDFTTVRTAFETWRTNQWSSFGTSQVMAGYKAYAMSYNPGDPGPGMRNKSNGLAFAPTGPPRYVSTQVQAGSGATAIPYQVAPSVTFRTALPRHWGRIYLPTPATSSLDSTGRLTSGFRTAMADGASLLGKTLSDGDFLPVVPMTDLNRQTFHGLLGVTQYVVDDIPDIQRRRRPRQAANRTIGA